MAPSRTAADASGSGDADWMDGLSGADVIRQYGVDPNSVPSSDGILRTPEGLEYEGKSSGSSESLSSESSNSSGSDEDKTTTSSSKSLTKSRVSDDPSTSAEYTQRKIETRRCLRLKRRFKIKKRAEARETGANPSSRKRDWI